MTPYLAASSIGAGTIAAAPAKPTSASIARAPSSAPNRICQPTISLKRRWRRRPAAAAPTRRLEQVGLPQSSPANRRRLARARDGSESGRTLPNSADRSVPQPPQRCASESKRLLCQCCRISDLLSMTPYLAAARPAPAPSPPRRRSRRQHRSPELHRRPRTGICQPTIPLKQKWRRRPAAAAPTRRLEQVGLPQSSPGNRRASRARVTAANSGRTLPNSDDRSVPQPPQRCASESKRPHCQCCRISDLLSMTPYLAALDRRRHHRRRPTRRSRRQHRSPELHRRPEPICEQQFR